MTDNKLWQCILCYKIICRLQGKLYLGIQGHASASVLNPIGNGEGSCNMYCISSLAAQNLNHMFLKMRNCSIFYNLGNSDTDLVLPKRKIEFKK